MVLGMTFFNVILMQGIHNLNFKAIMLGFIPIFFIALVMDWFFVGKMAKSIAAKVSKEHFPMIMKVLIISFFMVCGMCLSMTLITLILHTGISAHLPILFVNALWKNFLAAILLQFIIVGPIARTVFFKMFPVRAHFEAH
ncbi:hypothetical protein F3D3_1166 [Fusibacter sp. 3D3]|nr:hypothetical protein F3D3_1166 [Fusibacter sp. 3D3]